MPLILEDGTNGLTLYGGMLFKDLYEQLKNMIFKVEQYDSEIEKIYVNTSICKLICKLPGVGSLTATAITALVGNIKVFKNGRELAAYLGLVPKQHSPGGKAKLLGISKRRDRYVRCLLIHGARAILFRAKNLPTSRANWLEDLIAL